MGLDDVLRSAIATANSITNDLQCDVSHEAWISQSVTGTPTYAAAVTLRAVVEFKQKMRRSVTGEEVRQMATLTIVGPVAANGASARREPIDPRDRITLPNGYSGPILDVSGVVDPETSGPYTIEIALG